MDEAQQKFQHEALDILCGMHCVVLCRGFWLGHTGYTRMFVFACVSVHCRAMCRSATQILFHNDSIVLAKAALQHGL